jgi:hypothetical protein
MGRWVSKEGTPRASDGSGGRRQCLLKMVTIQWRIVGATPIKGEGRWRYRGISVWFYKIEVEKREEMRGSWAHL